jgi:uncharacterized membrane protein
MKSFASKVVSFFKTTAIGGLLFLLPVIAIGVLLGYIYKLVHSVYEPLKKILPVESVGGIFGVFALAVGIVVTLCFLCGILARRAVARRFYQTVEKQLVTVFPKYAIYKDLLAGKIGGDENRPTLIPVTVSMNDSCRVAFETDRLADGRVILYLPGAPDPWNGSVVLVSSDQVTPLDLPLKDVVGICETLGRECGPFFVNMAVSTTPPERR